MLEFQEDVVLNALGNDGGDEHVDYFQDAEILLFALFGWADVNGELVDTHV